MLVLGSMPGTASLEKHQYYGHPRNHFWPIIYGLFDRTPDEEYEKRITFAQERGIALWDVIGSCEREGSLDANIRNAEPNDLAGLQVQYPDIECVAFNGNKAYDTFKKHFGGQSIWNDLQLLKLPSSSPIPNNRMRTTADRIEAWSVLKPYLEPISSN